MLTLYDYQNELFNQIQTALKRSNRRSIIAVLPTGGGKTVVFSYIISRAMLKGTRTLVLTDRKELLTETGGTLRDFGLFPKYVSDGIKNPPTFEKGDTVVAMVKTLQNRTQKPHWQKFFSDIDLVIIDECHKGEFNVLFEQGIFKGKTVVGFSATPKRTGKQRQLGEDYDEIVDPVTVNNLIELDKLVPDLYMGVKGLTPDLTGVRKSKGDYSESGMFKKYDTPKIYGGVVKCWKEHHYGTSTLIFGVNISHCIRIVREFEKEGITAKFLTSGKSKPKPLGDGAEEPDIIKYNEKLEQYNEYQEAHGIYSGERTEIIEAWKGGEFKVLVNAGILTTGFNFKPLETIYTVRATMSLILWMQIQGRGSRISPDKTHFNNVDFGGNAQRLGSYQLPRSWQLYHEASKAGGGTPPMKVCGEDKGPDKHSKVGCESFIFASATICPICGYIYPEKKEEKEAELAIMTFNSSGAQKEVKPIRDMNFEEIEFFAKSSRYKSGWINIQLYNRGGENEIKDYAQFKGYSPGWATMAISRIPKYIKERYDISK